MNTYRAIAFDMYGTLFDVHSVARACEHEFPGKGAAITAVWRHKQLEYSWLRSLTGHYLDFEHITADALRFTCASFNLVLAPDTERCLCDEYLRLGPYPEMAGALRRLKDAGIACSIISNGTNKSIDHLVKNSQMEWAFDQAISVEQVRVFKPHPKVYRLAEQRIGLPRAEILFVSSNAWDASAAGLFGFPVCWVNRNHARFDELGATPTAVVPDLEAMAGWVLG